MQEKRLSKTYDLAVIGAGASGLAAAITAGRTGATVLLLEGLPRAGKKLLATGNGRCNLSNCDARSHDYHNRDFAAPALQAFGTAECEAFFDSLGLALCEDQEGRLYPRSFMAASVLDALRGGLAQARVELRCDTPVRQLKPDKQGFRINEEILARRVIVAAGGCAAPVHGSDGSGLKLLRALGHPIIEPKPALVQIKAKHPQQAALKGLRVRGEIKIQRNAQILRRAEGEILFTDDGLSGIAAMEVSRWAEQGYAAVLDLLPEYSYEELRRRLSQWKTANPQRSDEQLLTGLLPRRVAEAVVKAAGGDLAKMCKNFTFEVAGTRGFAQAQVTAGGADVSKFHKTTLESKIIPGLYACGEVLDVDGGCGGFNLHWAWASGILAAGDACSFSEEKEPKRL